MTPLVYFSWGALAMGAWVAALFFLRFWRDTRDRFFVFFALAFFTLGANWTLLALAPHGDETQHYFYAIRLFAFACIVGGVVDKNRAHRR